MSKDHVEFGERRTGHFQWPVKAIRNREHQQRWILCAFADESFSLEVVKLDRRGYLHTLTTRPNLPYAMFWSAIEALELDARRWWLAGFGIRKALHDADFVGALERGLVTLDTSKRKDGTVQRKGRLTFSANVIEMDLRVGENQLKVIDLGQLGLDVADVANQPFTNSLPEVRALFKGWIGACGFLGLSASRPTAAQIGWANVRANWMPDTLQANQNQEHRALERRAYHAGRNEAYFLGDVPGLTYSLDVKSCYAWICEARKLPVELVEDYPAGLDFRLIDVQGDDHWIADCVLQTEEPDYPVNFQGTPIYPIGRFRTALCWPELQHALRRGRVVRITRAQRYLAEFALRRYAQWFQASKQDLADSPYAHFGKMLKSTFNASLGYTARRKYEWVPADNDSTFRWMFGVTTPPDNSANLSSFQILDGKYEWLRIAGEPREAIPYLHATICSWARIRLLEIFHAAGRENILYCDTDGILTNHEGYRNLVKGAGFCGMQPGQLTARFEPSSATIRGQKNYRIGDNYVVAGLVDRTWSPLAEGHVLTTQTGRRSESGRVHPFTFDCEDMGGESELWRNFEA